MLTRRAARGTNRWGPRSRADKSACHPASGGPAEFGAFNDFPQPFAAMVSVPTFSTSRRVDKDHPPGYARHRHNRVSTTGRYA